MIKDFKALKISIASPQQVLSWSHGEVRKAETINYRTNRPEVDGLMCEKIFGPTKNFECYCGKYKKIRYKGIVCDKCGVEVTHKRVRRERIGHIKLASPVSHVWFSHGVPNKLSLILDIPQKKLETVIYFARYLVTSVNEEGKKIIIKQVKEKDTSEKKEVSAELGEKIKELTDKFDKQSKKLEKGKEKDKVKFQIEKMKNDLKKEEAKLRSIYAQKEEGRRAKVKEHLDLVESIEEGATISEDDYSALREYGEQFYEIGMGAEAIKKLVERLDLDKEIKKITAEIETTKSDLKAKKIVKRLRILLGMKKNNIDPTSIVTDIIPVLPADLRPIIQLAGGRFATSDLNDLYRRVINRNNRLKRLVNLGAPEIILRNEKRMLQEAVDALMDNSHRPGNAVLNTAGQPYKSLSDMLRGKQGRFRQNLLGKRVDYSGRAVIVAGPELSIYQCGIPKIMALELFKPFVIREIIADGFAPNLKSAKNYFESKSHEVWDILERVIKDRPVLLNRAPTLHKQGIQAFFPILTEGNAIQIHPMICSGFNADFDGDQMAVHVPLSKKAIEEVLDRMFASSNVLLQADGRPVINANKDMALGIYYLTGEKEGAETRLYGSVNEAIGAHNNGEVEIFDKVKISINEEIIESTIGRLIFNEILPEGFRFVNSQITKGQIGDIASEILEKYGNNEAVRFLDDIEYLGFKYATKSGISVSISDFLSSDKRESVLADVEKREDQLTQDYYSGLVTQEEKRRLIEQIWFETIDTISEDVWKKYEEAGNNLAIFEASGATPVKNPLRQISGVKGLILDPLGKTVELPLRSNYKDGLPGLEYFVAARGTRKGLADTALKTAESGYLTRRLVDVAQDVITRIEDCETKNGIYLNRDDERRMTFRERVTGRFAAENIIDEKTGEVIVKNGDEITRELAHIIDESGISKIKVRSALTCDSMEGICRKCYGYSLGDGKLIEKGIAVGVIAAQAMGEAATQLTLNTKHLGGRAGLDITQGLPRVAELFEARTPKAKAILSENDGKVKIMKDEGGLNIKIIVTAERKMEKEYEVKKGDDVPFKKSKKVNKGDVILIKKSGIEIKSEQDGQATLTDGKIIVSGVKSVEQEYVLEPGVDIVVKDGDQITMGTPLTAGSLDPKEIMEFRGVEEAQAYIIDQVQKTYGVQGIGLDDKHVEVVVRQMSRYGKITDTGGSEFLPEEYLAFLILDEKNNELKKANKEQIKYVRQILGITTAALKTESFLSSASFEQQVRVLTDAALVGKVDNLRGLKENVIIGRPVPLGKELLKKV
ncbi:DNA-directed RNA polymerase subunit beta' [Candidatus Dojkabacteria bacterium]|nr:DNA-directed RNA polymerase subunit beta' [Candidatus Dojkabacteria bacterium]